MMKKKILCRKKTGKINHNEMNSMKKENNKGCGKRNSAPFYRTIIVQFFSLCVFLITASIQAKPEVCGLWVVRDSITSLSEVEEVVNFADLYGYNVLFVQVRGRGDAFYKSYFVPGPEEFSHIPNTFDPLAAIIELAHARGIEVHAWFNMYFTWSSDLPPINPLHLVNSHPGWFMVSVSGINMAECPIDSVRNHLIEGRYISPALEEVRSYLSRVITEVLVSYNVDGVHLDYIRYPGWNYDFNHRISKRFSMLYGIDPVKVVLEGEKVDPTIEYLKKWIEYKTNQIDRQVRSVARRINLVNKNNKIRFSAAVKPDADEAYYEYGQNWVGWLNEGIVDFVVTMSYFPETDWVEDVLNDSLKKVDRRKVVGGIGAYKLRPEETAEQMQLMNDLGLLGYSIFSYTTFKEEPQFAESLQALSPFNNKLPARIKSD